jgi:hypothetical protein
MDFPVENEYISDKEGGKQGKCGKGKVEITN